MIKGVNRQVIEITQTKCEYFEKVLFFVKPEYAATSEGTLRERASLIADSAGIPPASKLKKRKLLSALKFVCSALAGAAVTAAVLAAKAVHHAGGAVRSARYAHSPAVEHAAVAEIVALLRIEQSLQLLFDLRGVLCVNESQEIRYSDKVRVGHNGWLAVDVADYEVRRFSADSG